MSICIRFCRVVQCARMTDSMLELKNESLLTSNVPPFEHGESNRTLFFYAVAALAIALFVRFYIATPYIVSGSSMENTFLNHDYLIIDRLSYDVQSPQRGDVIVFDLPQDESRALIKRVIALPGETVSLEGPEPVVTIINKEHPDGFKLSEPYLTSSNLGGLTNQRVTLEKDQFFVLGDHRSVSADSRTWGILPRKEIVGRVLLRLFPFQSIGVLPGKADYLND